MKKLSAEVKRIESKFQENKSLESGKTEYKQSHLKDLKDKLLALEKEYREMRIKERLYEDGSKQRHLDDIAYFLNSS